MKSSEKKKGKEKVSSVEVLNPKGVEAAAVSQPDADSIDDDDHLEGLPEITPSLQEFSKLPLWDFERSFQFIQQHRDVYVPGAPDALFLAAYTAQSEGKPKYAKQCIHQSLLLQYCEKLGNDGVGVFFKKYGFFYQASPGSLNPFFPLLRMISGDKRTLKVFQDDVEKTYEHVVNRVKINQEEAASREQIQLVPENPETTITFNVPTGPPPENLVLEGAGTEDLDIEEVRKALQFRWEIFQGFPKDLQEALETGELEKVNKVLGEMDVAEAEGIVNNLDVAGILSFADNKFRDETGNQNE